MPSLPIVASLVAMAPTPEAFNAPLETGLDGALRGCIEWVLNPGSWADGTRPFEDAVGPKVNMQRVDSVDALNFPPPELRGGNIYWRINSTASAGYVLIVSDVTPMCHITGGGDVDLQPPVAAVIDDFAFAAQWEFVSREPGSDGIVTTHYRYRRDLKLSLVISRPASAGAHRDRLQFVATAQYQLH